MMRTFPKAIFASIRPLGLALASLAMLLASTGGAGARTVSQTWTSSDDFGLGVTINVNYTDVADQLQLNLSQIETPFLWVANSASDTVAQIDPSSGLVLQVVAVGDNPSRVAIDLDFNCWVGMRGNESGDGRAQVMKVDAETGTVTPGPWVGATVRGVSVNRQGDIWVSSSELYGGAFQWKLVNPETMAVMISTSSNIGSYGIAMSPFGTMFSSTSWLGGHAIERFNAYTGELEQRWNLGSIVSNLYGFAVDSSGNLWGGMWCEPSVLWIDGNYQCPGGATECTITEGNGIIRRIDVSAELGSDAGGRGVAIDNNGDVWVVFNANCGSWTTASSYVVKLDGVTGDLLDYAQVGTAAVGVGYTTNGSIWTVNYGGGGPNYVAHACPGSHSGNGTITQLQSSDLAVVGSYPTCGNSPYTYSEMSGYSMRSSLLRSGTWTTQFDSQVDNVDWDAISWEELVSNETLIEVRARTSHDLSTWSTWVGVGNGQAMGVPPGRYLEIEVFLHTTSDSVSPILESLTVVTECIPDPTDDNCDAIDDDCNGVADDGYLSDDSCGMGYCRTNNIPSSCTAGVETDCQPGQQISADDPSCDGIDDNCDGEADEDYTASQTTCGVGACAALGSSSCLAGQEQDSCVPGTPAPDDFSCDGVDDDCDGEDDQDYAPQATTCGVGACEASGLRSCVDGQVQDSCVPGMPAQDDASCDGVDDDCSGQADEDYTASATTCGLGACAAVGSSSCVTGQEKDSCVPGTPAPDDASCNGIDDDCNGTNDQDYLPRQTTCGTGPCASSGVTTCVAGQEQNSCIPGEPALDDATCDGIDDDCDAVVDDDYLPRQTSCGTGACAALGTTTCIGGQEQDSCTTGDPALDDATCDLIDDDCDGLADEDYVSQSTNCGQGACAATGTSTCIEGQEQDSCQPGDPASDDTSCDGIDNDCDAETDEDFVSQPTQCGAGACSASGTSTCVDSQVVDSCVPNVPAQDDSICNGTDDDCDGTTDENAVCPLDQQCESGECIDSAYAAGSGCGCATDNNPRSSLLVLLLGIFLALRRRH